MRFLDRETVDYEILRCVDNGLSNCGPSIRHATYWQLLVVFNLKAGAITTYPEQFSNALEKIFGSGGAVMIERAIVKEIMKHFGIEYLKSTRFLSALEYVRGKEFVGKVPMASSSNLSTG